MDLFKQLGKKLNFSTSFHPQTDGKTERVNSLLELYLRHYASDNQSNWARILDISQFCYNMQRNEATGQSLFEIVAGRQPLTSNFLTANYEGSSPTTYNPVGTSRHGSNFIRQSSQENEEMGR